MRELKFRTWVDGRGMDYSEAWGRLGVFFDFHERTYGWDGFVLMQYTGLKDKNGRDIFEGDIIENEHKERWLVVYQGTGYQVALDGDQEAIYSANEYWFKGSEVIGNIYEHPHLLERRFDHATQTHAKSVHENAGQCY